MCDAFLFFCSPFGKLKIHLWFGWIVWKSYNTSLRVKEFRKKVSQKLRKHINAKKKDPIQPIIIQPGKMEGPDGSDGWPSRPPIGKVFFHGVARSGWQGGPRAVSWQRGFRARSRSRIWLGMTYDTTCCPVRWRNILASFVKQCRSTTICQGKCLPVPAQPVLCSASPTRGPLSSL